MTHADFIKELGGGTKVAEILSEASGENVDREAVYKWAERDFIPWKWRAHLIVVAKASDKTVPDDFLPGVAA